MNDPSSPFEQQATVAVKENTLIKSKEPATMPSKRSLRPPTKKVISHTSMSSPTDKIMSPTTKQLQARNKPMKSVAGLRGKLLAEAYKKEMQLAASLPVVKTPVEAAATEKIDIEAASEKVEAMKVSAGNLADQPKEALHNAESQEEKLEE